MSGGIRNEFTGTPYNSWDDVEKDLADHPGCKRKIMAIARRIQEVLSHQQITELCGMWGCVTQDEFWGKLNAMPDHELKEYVDRIKGRKRKGLLENTAVLVAVEAGVA